jgi:nucleoside-diphosphate-sugar epimerase
VRAFVTGGTGFVGRRLVALLRGRGDDVVALVRSPARAEGLDAELAAGDLTSRERLAIAMAGAHAVFHLAADYRIGIPAGERAAMYDVNVHGTENVLDAARDAGAERTVYVSTVNVFGNTRGDVVDETYDRPGGDFVSEYDRTKWLAHRAALDRIARGDPIVIVQPGVVYGPGDHSEIGGQLQAAARGKLLFVSFAGLGFDAVHVDDVATGILLAHDRGRVGASYVLGGEITTLGDAVRAAAAAGGRRPPRFAMPTAVMRPLVPVGPLVGRLMGTRPNLKELISASDDVTYWARDDKARRELGYAPRPLAAGLADTFGR